MKHVFLQATFRLVHDCNLGPVIPRVEGPGPRRLLLRDAVDVAAPQQNVARGHSHHFAVREDALQNLLGPATSTLSVYITAFTRDTI
jgi:hypothetical protein